MEIWAALMIEYDNVRAALRFYSAGFALILWICFLKWAPTAVKMSLRGGQLNNVRSGDGDGTANNSSLGFTLGTATIPNPNVGEYDVQGINITLKGTKADNYTLTQPTGIKVTITAKSLASDLNIGSVSSYTYTGSEHKPKPTVSDSLQTLVEGRDCRGRAHNPRLQLRGKFRGGRKQG